MQNSWNGLALSFIQKASTGCLEPEEPLASFTDQKRGIMEKFPVAAGGPGPDSPQPSVLPHLGLRGAILPHFSSLLRLLKHQTSVIIIAQKQNSSRTNEGVQKSNKAQVERAEGLFKNSKKKVTKQLRL